MQRSIDFLLEKIVDIIIASLLVDRTPVPRKVARLHLICDILHNSAAPLPMAWKFRQEFQARLGLVFDHFSTIYHSFPGRITAETFKKQISAVVDIWDDWIVFPPEFTRELRMRLEGMAVQKMEEVEVKEEVQTEESASSFKSKFKSKFTASSFKPAEEVEEVPQAIVGSAAAEDDDDDGEPMDVGSDVDGEPAGEDLDGEPIADDVDGEPIVQDIDGVPMAEDIDGTPIVEDLDGEPMEDVDGEPMDDIDGAPVQIQA